MCVCVSVCIYVYTQANRVHTRVCVCFCVSVCVFVWVGVFRVHTRFARLCVFHVHTRIDRVCAFKCTYSLRSCVCRWVITCARSLRSCARVGMARVENAFLNVCEFG